MLAQLEQRTWTTLGWGSGAAHVAIEASGRSGGILLAWKEELLDHLSTWRGRHVAAAHLESQRDGTPFVVASMYIPTHPGRREELWEDLRQLHGAFPETPMLIGGDFNITLRANDRPNGGGGRDPGSAQFRELIDSLSLAEIGPLDRRFSWSGQSSQSRLDRFLCSVEMLAAYPLAVVSALLRPLSDHTPITWSAKAGDARPTYFKMDRSWVRDEKLKADISEWWRSRLTFGQTADQLATKLKDLRHHLFDLHRKI